MVDFDIHVSSIPVHEDFTSAMNIKFFENVYWVVPHVFSSVIDIYVVSVPHEQYTDFQSHFESELHSDSAFVVQVSSYNIRDIKVRVLLFFSFLIFLILFFLFFLIQIFGRNLWITIII